VASTRLALMPAAGLTPAISALPALVISALRALVISALRALVISALRALVISARPAPAFCPAPIGSSVARSEQILLFQL
jgi:hypothetical protein